MTLIVGDPGNSTPLITGADRLDAQARLILNLRFTGLSVPEIAELAGCPETAVFRIVRHSVSGILEDAATETVAKGEQL